VSSCLMLMPFVTPIIPRRFRLRDWNYKIKAKGSTWSLASAFLKGLKVPLTLPAVGATLVVAPLRTAFANRRPQGATRGAPSSRSSDPLKLADASDYSSADVEM